MGMAQYSVISVETRLSTTFLKQSPGYPQPIVQISSVCNVPNIFFYEGL